MTDLTLHEITEGIYQIVNAEDFGDEQVELLDKYEMALEKKAGNIVNYTDHLAGFVAMAKAEEKRIADRRKAVENRIKSLKDYIKNTMDGADLTKITCGTKTISIQNSNPSVVIDDESQIPPQYYTIIPEQYQLDKKLLAKDLKDGDIPGAKLQQGTSLRIR